MADSEHERRAYHELIVEVLLLLGADEQLARRDADDMLRFEIELANVYPHTHTHTKQSLAYLRARRIHKSMT
jgi:hypothetical protein